MLKYWKSPLKEPPKIYNKHLQMLHLLLTICLINQNLEVKLFFEKQIFFLILKKNQQQQKSMIFSNMQIVKLSAQLLSAHVVYWVKITGVINKIFFCQAVRSEIQIIAIKVKS